MVPCVFVGDIRIVVAEVAVLPACNDVIDVARPPNVLHVSIDHRLLSRQFIGDALFQQLSVGQSWSSHLSRRLRGLRFFELVHRLYCGNASRYKRRTSESMNGSIPSIGRRRVASARTALRLLVAQTSCQSVKIRCLGDRIPTINGLGRVLI